MPRGQTTAGTDTTWGAWNVNTVTLTGTSVTTGDNVFHLWCTGNTVSCATTSVVWETWASDATDPTWVRMGTLPHTRVRTYAQAEMPKARVGEVELRTLVHGIRDAVFALQAQEREERKKAAKVRARTLLDSLLDDGQRHTMEHKGYIPVYVEGPAPPAAPDYRGGGRKPTPLPERREYWIMMNGRHGNVKRVENDKVVESLCVAPGDSSIPEEDAWAAQLLFLRYNEHELRSRANVTLYN